MPHARVFDVFPRWRLGEPGRGSGHVQVQTVVGARPHSESAKGRHAADSATDGDRTQLVAIDFGRREPAAPWPGDQTGGERCRERGIRASATAKGDHARDSAELSEYGNDVGHGSIVRVPPAPGPRTASVMAESRDH
ncbi:hypothetical protein GCM10009749_10900 [Agromyces neolithicus]|uniref:Uncharacterized protein n=1 Tax=Agromyces neolithicus TaxID=269420 RepID=A0ABN2M1B8_9MICO